MAKNRNVRSTDNTFGDLPKGKLKRNLFNMKGSTVTTMFIGELTPILVEEVLPGDVWTLQNEIACRFNPMYFPAMVNMSISTHYFYIPNRICWEGWEDFITGNDDGLIFPTINLSQGDDGTGNASLAPGSVGCHMGLPTNSYTGAPVTIDIDFQVAAIPFHAYAMIYDHYYRSDLIQDKKVTWELTSGVNNTSDLLDVCFLAPFHRSWNHDYFTSALPTATLGENVIIPLLSPDQDVPLRFDTDSDPNVNTPPAGDTRYNTTTGYLEDNLGSQTYLDASVFNQFAADIQSLRLAVKLLEFYEASNRHSTRYRDMMIGEYGIDPTPGVIDEPKYIGGGKARVQIQDVMSTSNTLTPSDDSIQNVVGDYAGQALAIQNTKRIRFFAPEHGYIICIASMMPRSSYYTGMHRKWTRLTRLDFAWDYFAHIGDQEIKQQELYWSWWADGTPWDNRNNETFGYVPRYEEYRHGSDVIAGDMRTSLTSWHFGRQFEPLTVALNDEFLQCVPRTGDVFVKASSADPDVYMLVVHNNMVFRNLAKFGIPGM